MSGLSTRINKKEDEVEEAYDKINTVFDKENLAIYRDTNKDVNLIVLSLFGALPQLTATEVKKGLLWVEANKYDRYGKKLKQISKQLGKMTNRINKSVTDNTNTSYTLGKQGENWAFDGSIDTRTKFKSITPDEYKNVKFSNKYENTWTSSNKANNKKLFGKIQRELQEGLNQGKSLEKVAGKINDLFAKFKVVNGKKSVSGGYADALRISRTERHRALNQGRINSLDRLDGRMKRIGYKVKRIIQSVHDKRTRRQSAIVDGRVADKNGYFLYPNGNLYRTPGDTGIKKYDINDRETVITKTVKIKTGKPMIKRDLRDLSFKDFAKKENLIKNKYGERILEVFK